MVEKTPRPKWSTTQVDDALRPPRCNDVQRCPRGTSIIIWTTTPWTIPGNRGIAFSAEANYGIYEVTAVAEGSTSRVGERLVLADKLSETVQDVAQIEAWTRTGDAGGLNGTICAHPLRGKGYEFDVPVLPGDFVTMEQGTGLVHRSRSWHGRL